MKCKANDIHLIQIFEDEWYDKRPLLESMIKNRLNMASNKISARKTDLKPLSDQDKSEFFENHHIGGNVRSMVAYGLFEGDELVMAISLRNTWNKKYGNVIEIARLASKSNSYVIGGFSKLMKQVELYAKENDYEGILTYSDCRFGPGHVYSIYGFKHLGKTKPNYFYEKDGIRENRFKHRKIKDLEGITERIQQNSMDWYAIYDAGNEIYVKKVV